MRIWDGTPQKLSTEARQRLRDDIWVSRLEKGAGQQPTVPRKMAVKKGWDYHDNIIGGDNGRSLKR